jgi:hypothetical protein
MNTDNSLIAILNTDLQNAINTYRHTDRDDTSKLETLRSQIEELKTRIAALAAWSTNS